MVSTAPEAEELAETNRFSLDIEGINLPTDEGARQELLDTIAERVDQILEEEGFSADELQAKAGHHFAQISPTCPRCNSSLSIRSPVTLKNELPANAHASVYCSQCGYGAGALYALVDIEKNKYEAEHKAERYRSEVNDRVISPEYHSY